MEQNKTLHLQQIAEKALSDWVCKVFAQKIQEYIRLLRAFRASDRLRVRIAEGTENTENTEKEGFAKITL